MSPDSRTPTAPARRPGSRAARRLRLVPLPALALTIGLLGCQSAAPRLSKDSVLVATPIEPQAGPSECGLACLTALLGAWDMTLDDAGRARFAPERLEREGGVQAGELRDYLRDRGLRAALVRGRFDAEPPTGLFALLDRGLPLIVRLQLDTDGGPRSHFVLVNGYDPEKRWILIMDPDRGAIGGITYERFRETWQAGGHLLLVAAPERA